MNQKIVGIIPLMVAMMFVAVFAVGDNQAAAAIGPDSADQTVTVNVQNNIALSVDPTSVTMENTAGTNPTAGEKAYSGAGEGDDNIGLTNDGNVPIKVSVKSVSDAAPFTTAAFTVKTSSGDVGIDTTGSAIIVSHLLKGDTANTHLTLDIPATLDPGVYSNTLTYTAVLG